MTARDRKILLVLVGLAVLAGFWFLAVRPKQTKANALVAEIETQQRRLETAQHTVAQGLQAKADYPRNYATVVELGKAVPADDDLPSLLYQLDSVASGADVEFQSLVRPSAASAAPAPSGGAPSSGKGPGAAGPSGSGGSAGTSSPGVTAALPPGATVGTAGLATLPFTFTFSGSFFGLQRFIGDVQRFVRTGNDSVAVRGRLLTIDGLSLSPGPEGLSKIEAKVVATAYLSPGTQDPAKGAGPSSATPPGSPPASGPAQTSSAISGGTS